MKKQSGTFQTNICKIYNYSKRLIFFFTVQSIPFPSGWPTWQRRSEDRNWVTKRSIDPPGNVECQCSTLIYFIITRTLCLISFVFLRPSVPHGPPRPVACLSDRGHKKVSHHLASIMQRSRPPNSKGAREWASGLHKHTCVHEYVARTKEHGQVRSVAECGGRRRCAWVPTTIPSQRMRAHSGRDPALRENITYN